MARGSGNGLATARSSSRALLADLTVQLGSVVQVQEQAPPGGVGEWACQKGVILDRGPFSFSRHEYLEVPYKDNHPYQVEKKCAQMGNTTRALLRAFYAAIYLNFVGVLYLFPSKTGSSDFSKTRVTPLIDKNFDAIGKYVTETDSVSIKRIKNCNLLLRGTRSTEGLRSDPTDLNIYDEFDLFEFNVEEVADARIAHSDFGWTHYLSNPTLPNFGIDKKFQETDQRYWLLKCPKCGKWTNPVEEWEINAKPSERLLPDLIWEKNDGTTVLRCTHCHDGILEPSRGVWVAKKPSITEKRGYQYSHLFSQYVKLGKLVDKYLNTTDMQALYNYGLGLGYVAAENVLTEKQVLNLCGSYGMVQSDNGPNYMGVDQQDLLNITIGDKAGNIKFIGERKEFDELDVLMKDFNVFRSVVDAQPEKRLAKAFASRFPGKVYLNWYDENKKGGAVWDDENFKVSVDRTESMDASHACLSSKDNIVLPRENDIIKKFAFQCTKTARQLKEDDKGNKRYIWVKLGPDHFRHSFNYYNIARGFSSNSIFAGLFDA
jgi:Bacteriophage tail assembly protein